MSTRSFIKFIQGKESVIIYRHSDGYPSGFFGDFEKFIKWNGWRSTDLSYTVVNFVTYFKVEHALHSVKYNVESKNDGPKTIQEMLEKPEFNSALHLGYGICEDMTDKEIQDSWAAFYYVVNFDEDRVTSYAATKDKLVKLGDSKLILNKEDKHEKSYTSIKHSKKIEKEIKNY